MSTNAKPGSPLLIVVTGLSGSGHSTALKALEDNGVYCVDNLPLELLPSTVAHLESNSEYAEFAFAFGMDVRNHRFAEQFLSVKKELSQKHRLDVLFLTADSQVLATRFNATRRRHPLVKSGVGLEQAISNERSLLSTIEEGADVVLDTSNWSPHQLARAVEVRYASEIPRRKLLVTIYSFGFKYGQHRMVDSIFDVRFLRNPNYRSELKPLTGKDPEVSEYVFEDPAAREMLDRITGFNRFVLPQYYKEGKSYFRLGIGCSGGRHRSVAMVERVAAALREKPLPEVLIETIHRDIDKANHA